MKKLLIILTIFCAFTVAHGQTNVSGGIFTNTTWSLVNSPYIVVDTVVVFPGVTLTIQPGVAVRFANNKRLEIRGRLIANGTNTDSITFTSNSLSPTSGIWSSIYFSQADTCSFNYCNFYYASFGIQYPCPMSIRNSNFKYNDIGLGWVYAYPITIDSCVFAYNNYGIKWANMGVLVSNSNFHNNQYGIFQIEYSNYINCKINFNSIIGISSSQGDTIRYCEIKHNGIGFQDASSGGMSQSHINMNIIDSNSVGIELRYWYDDISCNKICNNSLYALKQTSNINTNCVINNYWCTPDSTSTEVIIYDGYDNINLGLVSFMPMDTVQCYLGSPTSITETPHIRFSLFPNPFSTQATLQTQNPLHDATLSVYNSFGQIVEKINNISGQTINLQRDNLPSGIYFVQLTQDDKILMANKIIITD